MTAVNDRPVSAPTVVPVRGRMPVWQQAYALRLIGVDVAGILLAVGLAQWLRFGGLSESVSAYRSVDYTVVSFAIAALWLSALAINRSRSPRIIGSGAEEYRRVWLATLSPACRRSSNDFLKPPKYISTSAPQNL